MTDLKTDALWSMPGFWQTSEVYNWLLFTKVKCALTNPNYPSAIHNLPKGEITMIKVAKLSFAHVHARGYAEQIQKNPETELVAVWDEEEYGGKEAAARYNVPFYSDLDQVLSLDEVDAVVVDAITSDHPKVIIAAAEAGKHIFTEKALAITVGECDPIIEAVEKRESNS